MSQFNNTSVNTIRVMTYRSLATNEVVIPNAILRVGAEGKDVDNAHAGGMFCGISANGVLGKYMCDYLGNKKKSFNGVDYSNSDFVFLIIIEWKNLQKRLLIRCCIIDY